MGLVGNPRHGFGQKFLGGLQTTAKVLGTAKTVYDIGRTAFQVGRALAPVAAALL